MSVPPFHQIWSALSICCILQSQRTWLITGHCGVDPVGQGWAQSNVRYYLYAYLYVVFAVDAMYLPPWATVLSLPGFGWRTLAEMAIFLGVLAVGLAHAWRRRLLRLV